MASAACCPRPLSAARPYAMVLGPAKGRELLEELPGCEGYLVTKNLEVTRTSVFTVL